MQTTTHSAQPSRAYPADEPAEITAAKLAAQLRATAQILESDPALSRETVNRARDQHQAVGRVLFVLHVDRAHLRSTSCFTCVREARA